MNKCGNLEIDVLDRTFIQPCILLPQFRIIYFRRTLSGASGETGKIRPKSEVIAAAAAAAAAESVVDKALYFDSANY